MLRLLLFTLLLIFSACAGDNFDEAAYPAGQKGVMMAFKRMSEHGRMEPVLEEGVEFSNWQFRTTSRRKLAVLGGEPETTIYLSDGSGIEYFVTSGTSPIVENMELSYGYGTGLVRKVERDLAAGEILVEVVLEAWAERE